MTRGGLLPLGLGLILAAVASAVQADPCDAPLPARGAPFTGTVQWIIDGDSLCVSQPGGRMIEVRLRDFNAPEWNAPGGEAAWSALVGHTLGRTVECTGFARSYDRIIAVCRLEGVSIGAVLRAEGWPEAARQTPRRLSVKHRR